MAGRRSPRIAPDGGGGGGHGPASGRGLVPHERSMTMARQPRRRLTDAQRDERRQADRERLGQAARELLSSDGWARWMRVRATNGLARYSLFISRRSCQTGLSARFQSGRHVVDRWVLVLIVARRTASRT